MPINTGTGYLYFAIPKMFVDRSCLISFRLENFNTGISIELMNNDNNSKEFTLTRYNKTHPNTNVEYYVYEYQTNRFYLDSKVRFVCEFRTIFPE